MRLSFSAVPLAFLAVRARCPTEGALDLISSYLVATGCTMQPHKCDCDRTIRRIFCPQQVNEMLYKANVAITKAARGSTNLSDVQV